MDLIYQTCTRCLKSKHESEFGPKKDKQNGLDSWCHTCYAYVAKKRRDDRRATDPEAYYQKLKDLDKERRRRRMKILNAYLSEHPCVDCGETDLIVLDFDHVRGEKFSEVARMFHSLYSMKRIFEEIAKCDVVCSNCHRRRTARRGKGWLRSGKI
jgi:hypothetical protein